MSTKKLTEKHDHSSADSIIGINIPGFSYSIQEDNKWIHFEISINTDDHKRFSRKEILGTLKGMGTNFCSKHIL